MALSTTGRSAAANAGGSSGLLLGGLFGVLLGGGPGLDLIGMFPGGFGDPAYPGNLGDPGIPGGDYPGDPAATAAVDAQMHAYLKSVSAGTLALLTASVVSLAMTGAGTDGPHGLLDVQARDSAGATAITEMVKALSGEGEAGGWDVQRDGDEVRVSVGDPGGGALVDSARFRSAIPALSTTTTLAAYVDVQGLLKATKVVNAGVMRRWAPVQAVGLAVGQSGGDLTATLRIIVA